MTDVRELERLAALPVPPTPPREAILTTTQVAAWLQISEEQVRRLNLPSIPVGKRRWRYIAGQILDALEKRAE